MNQTLSFDIARPWRTHPRETVGLGVLGLATAIALVGAVNSSSGLPIGAGRAEAAMPALPDINAIRPVAAETALQINSQQPFATGPNPAARPFSYAGAGTESRERALECLTSAIYYEAGEEPLAGQQGVAQVVLNRVRHPAFPSSVCGVVYQGSTRATGCQFTFTCDGSLARAPERSSWNRAREVARAALAGFVQPSVGNATHYHANYVAPYWAPTLAKTAAIGAHLFYRWSGGWGRPAAFAQSYSGREADPRVLRVAALSVPHEMVVPAAPVRAVAKIEGVQVVQNDGKRVRVLFTPEAREAVEKVKVTPYVETVAASDNLRFALNGASADSDQRPFGHASAGAGNQGGQ
jgi:hypothetical protein